MVSKKEIAANWLKRYTGSGVEELGNWILLTNFQDYVNRFAEKY